MEPLNADKLAGRDLRAFAEANEGTRAVIVELDQPTVRAAPPAVHLPGLRRPGIQLSPAEAEPEDVEERMSALEREVLSLHPPSGLTRLGLARAFALTVTPDLLRALTQLRHVGIIRLRQTYQSAS